MDLKEELTQQMKAALKGGQKQRLSTIRMLLSELQNEQLKGGQVDPIAVVKRYAKSLTRAMEDFAKAGDQNRVDQAKAELAIVDEFLPQMLTEQQLEAAIDKILADNSIDSPKQMGQAMGLVMKAYPGRVDGGKAQQILKARLTGQ